MTDLENQAIEMSSLGRSREEREPQSVSSAERTPLISPIPSSSDDRGSSSDGSIQGVSSTQYPGQKTNGRAFVVVLAMVSAMGGFLFGYDTGVVSGAILEIRKTFLLSPVWLEVIVSVTLAAAALSAFVSGFLCDLIGRRPTLIIASVVFTVGAVVLGASYHAYVLLIGRVVIGVGIGMAAMAVPMYIAESAPSSMRGKLVVTNVMFITGGQCIATLVDGGFSYLRYDIGWRFMLGLAGIPSVLMFLGLLFMPESPRWLVFHGKDEKALAVLRKTRAPEEVGAELRSIIEDFQQYKKQKMGCGTFAVKFCTSRHVLLALVVGCGLQFFQQFAGINTVMYYSASIIQMAGFPDRSAIWLATVPGASNFIFTILGLLLVDRLGRRKLLLASVTGTILSFLLLSVTFVLMTQHSPPARPYDTENGTCPYVRCGSCVGNSGCSFCADFDPSTGEVLNGTCLSVLPLRNGSSVSRYVPRGKECALFGEDVPPYHPPSASSLETSGGHLTSSSSSSSSSSISTAAASPAPGNSSDPYQRKWYQFSCPHSSLAPMAVVALFLYIAFFAPGMGPLPWTINSEIYPTWARSTAISLATTTNWVCNLVVSLTFLTMADRLGQPVTFGFYAGMCLLALLFVALLVPETKGRSLEDMEDLFRRPHFLSWCSVRKRGNSTVQ